SALSQTVNTVAGPPPDTTPPTVSIASPKVAAKPVKLSGSISITGNAGGNSSSFTVTVAVASTGTANWSTACTSSAASWACTWDSTRVPDGGYTIKATAKDAAGNTSSASVDITVSNTHGPH